MSFFIGLSAGIFGGLVGLGGGILMIPLMVRLKALRQRETHGTSMVALVFTGIIGSLTYSLHHTLDIGAAILLAAAALWPVRYGAQCCHGLNEAKLRRVFGSFLIFVSVLVWIGSCLVKSPGIPCE